jgi:hypothetical protein
MATEQEREARQGFDATGPQNIIDAGQDEMAEANALVNGDRAQAYGRPRPAYDAMAQVWSGLLAHKLTAPLTPEDVILLLTGMKLTREARRAKRDNRVDVHGYMLVLTKTIEDAPKA